ncbi:MAG: nitroreductase family protein [Lentisphaerae bacterium]|nr:nitroreductase family protein [Lentisphaerota bacterium]MCP4101848.1 nitroreductase family protein [Lentisphaerota bacterium]
MDSKLDFIFKRRSVRKYTNEPVSATQLNSLLEAAMSAPSAVAKDPWRFIIVRDQKNLEAISSFLPNGSFLSSAACAIIICGDINKAHANSLSYMIQDCSAAIENILLAATALNLGACWLGVHPREDRIENITNFCKLPSHIIPIGVISLGHPVKQPEPRSRYNPKLVIQEKWSTENN